MDSLVETNSDAIQTLQCTENLHTPAGVHSTLSDSDQPTSPIVLKTIGCVDRTLSMAKENTVLQIMRYTYVGAAMTLHMVTRTKPDNEYHPMQNCGSRPKQQFHRRSY